MEVFNTIYQSNAWGAGGGSGPGSEPMNTVQLRQELTKLVITHKVTRFVDAACGAGMWASVWLTELTALGIRLQYVGLDISSIAISRAREMLAPLASLHDITLHVADITQSSTTELITEADIVLCRDVIQHMTYADSVLAIQTLAGAGAKLYILGGELNGQPRNAITGESYSPINYGAPPYCLYPTQLIREMHCARETKYLFVFDKL
jgi:SAM-dependent methyltransferase